MQKITHLKDDIYNLIRISIPLIGSMLSGLIMMIVDRICLSRYSENTLAASGPAIFTSMTILMFFIGIAGIVRVFIGQANGKKDKTSIAVSAITGIIIAVTIGIMLVLIRPIIVLIPNCSSRPIIVKALEQDFLGLVPYFGFFMILNSSFGSIYNGLLKTRIPLFVGVIGNVLNALFTVLFVFGFCGFPELGIKGSPIGTLLASSTCSLIYILILSKSDIFKPFFSGILTKRRIILKSIITMLKIGIPSGVSQALDEMGQTAFVWIVGSISLSGLMANNIGLAVNYVIIIPLIGLGIGVNILIANAVGSGEKEKVFRIIQAGFIIALVYTLAITILELLFPSLFIIPFISKNVDSETFTVTINVVKVLFTYAIAFSFTMILGGALEAVGLTKHVLWIRLIITWGLSLPILYFFVKSNPGKSDYISICWIIGSFFELIIGLVYGLIFYVKGKKQQLLI